jgi:RNA polymerase-interacting CarD/CdnL/TRCF family regulator
VNTAASVGVRLTACLAQIQTLLEKGQVTEAAALVSDLNAIVASAPEPMAETELMEARQVLARCGELEQSLRQSDLEALQRLGATRRSRVYRQP